MHNLYQLNANAVPLTLYYTCHVFIMTIQECQMEMAPFIMGHCTESKHDKVLNLYIPISLHILSIWGRKNVMWKSTVLMCSWYIIWCQDHPNRTIRSVWGSRQVFLVFATVRLLFCLYYIFLFVLYWNFVNIPNYLDKRLRLISLCTFFDNLFFKSFLKVFGGHMSIFRATGTPVLDFWWRLLWVSKPEWAALFALRRQM